MNERDTARRTARFRGWFVSIIAISIARTLFSALPLNASPFTAPQTAPCPFSLKWHSDPKSPRRVSVEVLGFTRGELNAIRQARWTTKQWQQLFAVKVQESGAQDVPAMLGTYHIRAKSLRFEPQFPLQPNVRYRAVFLPHFLPHGKSLANAAQRADFTLTAPETPPTTTVIRIYPTASTLPENLLKFYVQFSAPMSRGRIYEHIHLRDATAKEVELPFLEIDEELWDSKMQRLTLFLDPGRIKRGVLPLMEVGPSLESGKQYTLTIDSAWRDDSGTPLQAAFVKRFTVGLADRTPLSPAGWLLSTPKSGSKVPLTVLFPEPLDHALAVRMIRVIDAKGREVSGIPTLLKQECLWSFQPTSPWRRGSYQLAIQTTLEDLAGNNIGKPFDVDLFDTVQRRLTSAIMRRRFSIR